MKELSEAIERLAEVLDIKPWYIWSSLEYDNRLNEEQLDHFYNVINVKRYDDE